MVPTGYSLSGTLPRGIRIASFNLLRIGMLETRIADLRPVQDASEGLRGFLDLFKKPGGRQKTIHGDEQDPDHMTTDICEDAL
jgi:hypothetical protein